MKPERTRYKYLLHAAANVLEDGSSVVIVGDSGAGKTTLSNYLANIGLKKIADDSCFLMVIDGKLLVEPCDKRTGSLSPQQPIEEKGERYPVSILISLKRTPEGVCEWNDNAPISHFLPVFFLVEDHIRDLVIMYPLIEKKPRFYFHNCDKEIIWDKIRNKVERGVR